MTGGQCRSYAHNSHRTFRENYSYREDPTHRTIGLPRHKKKREQLVVLTDYLRSNIKRLLQTNRFDFSVFFYIFCDNSFEKLFKVKKTNDFSYIREDIVSCAFHDFYTLHLTRQLRFHTTEQHKGTIFHLQLLIHFK